MKIIEHKKQVLLCISLLLIAGFLATSLVSYFVSLSALRNEIQASTLPLTSDNIYSEIQRDLLRPVFISSLMSHDTFLRDWVLGGEKEEVKITRYLKEIMQKYGTFTSFFVSDKTHRYYHASGILKRVSPDEPRDVWYFRVRDMETEYEINVDPDMANRDAMTIFVNYKVFDYHGNYLGATGVGLTIRAVVDLMEKYSQKYNRNIYFTDKSGHIVLRNSSFTTPESSIYTIEGLSELASGILATPDGRDKYKSEGHVIHINTRYIPELDWYLFVEQTEDTLVQGINRTLLLNLLICGVITLVVLVFSMRAINQFQRVTNDHKNEILKQHEALLEKHEELEKTAQEKTKALKQNEWLMKEMHHRIKNNLATIQSLLRLQSREVQHNDSRMALLDTESRVRSLTNIHEMLSKSNDLAQVGVHDYVKRLVKDLAHTYQIDLSKIHIQTHVEPVEFDVHILIPFSLILNELITNVFKYAFPDQRKGDLTIELHAVGPRRVELIVQDNGVGIPNEVRFDKPETLGMRIIQSLVEQIRGQWDCTSEPDQGTRVNIAFSMDAGA